MLIHRLCATLFFILTFVPICQSYGRSGDLADPSFLTTGNEAICLSVSIGTSTPVLTYNSTNSGFWDREILLQNSSTDWDVYCSTSGANTGWTASSGPRFLLPKNPTGFTTQVRTDFYCILESAAGAATVDVVGIVEFDLKD